NQPAASVPDRAGALRREYFHFGPATALVVNEPDGVIAGRREGERGQRVGWTAWRREQDAVGPHVQPETVVAVHSKAPRAGRRNRHDAGRLDDEILHVLPRSLRWECVVVDVMRLAAGPEKVDHGEIAG